MLYLPSYKKVIKDNRICLLAETHTYLDGMDVLSRVDGKVFVNERLSCIPCEQVVKSKKYAVAVNTGQINYSYELYYDTCITTGFENLIRYSNIIDKEQIDKLNQLLEDLHTFHNEKKYDIVPKTKEQKLDYLRKQNHYIENFSDDAKSDVKFIIHLPIGRIGTTPNEEEIIRSLSTKTSTNIYKKYFVIYKEMD